MNRNPNAKTVVITQTHRAYVDQVTQYELSPEDFHTLLYDVDEHDREHFVLMHGAEVKDRSYVGDLLETTDVVVDLGVSTPDENLLGTTFVDPYLGRDDVVWEVDAMLGGGDTQAQIVASDRDYDLGTQDLYSVEFVKNNRVDI